MRKAHNDLEELLTLGLGLGYCHWSEALEVATNTILLLDSKPNPDKSFEQEDGVDRGDIELVSLLPPDARDANTARLTILRRNWTKLSRDTAVGLSASKFNKASACFFLVLCPVVFHGVKITLEFEACLQGVDGIGIEVLWLAHSHG